MKAYDAANRERRRERQREYHAANPEKKRRAAAKYRAANPTKIREQRRAWRKANPERVRENVRRREAQKAGVENTFNAEEEVLLWDMYKGCCYVCREPATTVDHVIPISKGGPNNLNNCRPACKSCNFSKGAKDVLEWLEPRWKRVEVNQ